MNLGENFIQARKKAGLSVYMLSKLSGVTEVHIYQIEKGITRNPGVVTLSKLLKVMNTTLDEVVSGEEKRKDVV